MNEERLPALFVLVSRPEIRSYAPGITCASENETGSLLAMPVVTSVRVGSE